MKRRHTYPSDIDLKERRQQADRRRAVLTAAGCSTYTLGGRAGTPAIVCLCCGLGSSDAADIRRRYCGFCKATHSEWAEKEKVH